MEALASDRSALRAALLSKPRNQAYVYITESLYRSLCADGPAFLGDLRGGGVTLTLHRRPPASLLVPAALDVPLPCAAEWPLAAGRAAAAPGGGAGGVAASAAPPLRAASPPAAA